MILVTEYHHLNITTEHHKSQSQKHQYLTKKPSQSRVGAKLAQITVVFVMRA